MLKPFIYAAAFDAGVATPKTILNDSLTAWPGYAPGNFDRAFRGRITAAEALAESRNIPALLMLSQVGVEYSANLMGAAGLRTLARRPERYGLSLAVGGAEATPLEVAEAFATLARGGIARPVAFEGSRLRDQGPSPKPLLRPAACWQTIAAISSPWRTADICPEAASLRVAWKTGTSSGYRDAWCAAVTPHRTIVVWLGNTQGEGSHSLLGAQSAAPLALRLIAAIASPMPWPADVDSAPLPVDESPFLPASRRLALIWPVDNTEIVYNSDLPPDRQRVLLRAAPARQGDRTAAENQLLWWFVDGKPAGTTRGDERLFWLPAPGRHEVRVIDAHGHAATSRIRVR